MSKLPPGVAADLAKEAYSVQNPLGLKVFLMRKEFSRDASRKRMVLAEVGGRLICTTDGFGLCAEGGEAHPNELFLIFRGSTTANYGADWLSNARIGVEFSHTGQPVHIGFNHIFSSMRGDLETFIRDYPQANTVHCIGHSLGGAVAALAADWVATKMGKKAILYTYGAPKPGFEMFSRALTLRLGPENIHRVYHSTDPVPMVPVYPFVHSPLPGYGHHIEFPGAAVNFSAHKIANYVASARKADRWLALSCPPPAFGGDKLVEQWLTSDKSINPFNPRTWSWINAGLEYVLKSIMKVWAVSLQAPFIGALTLADRIAWMLRHAVDTVVDVSVWVFRLMRKMMQALGMKVVDTIQELTRALMRTVLMRAMERIGFEARKAIEHMLSGQR